jgi:hypothetical protein
VSSGLVQILLLEVRRHSAGHGVRSVALAHLVLLRKMLDAHLRLAHGACVGAQRCARFATILAVAEARNLVNSKNSPLSRLYSFPRKERGMRHGVRSENGSPLTGRDIAKLPRCPRITVSDKSQL